MQTQTVKTSRPWRPRLCNRDELQIISYDFHTIPTIRAFLAIVKPGTYSCQDGLVPQSRTKAANTLRRRVYSEPLRNYLAYISIAIASILKLSWLLRCYWLAWLFRYQLLKRCGHFGTICLALPWLLWDQCGYRGYYAIFSQLSCSILK